MPPIPLPSISGQAGYGGSAVNFDGTLFASVDNHKDSVYIYHVDAKGERTAAPVVFGSPPLVYTGITEGQLWGPRFVCFVHRRMEETLLIGDFFNLRLVEVKVTGEFLRAIAIPDRRGKPLQFTYCSKRDIIVVSLGAHHTVVLDYASGLTATGVKITADSDYILFSDFYENSLKKFNAATGAFITDVVLEGILWPLDVLQMEDGCVLLAQQGCADGNSIVFLGADGSTVEKFFFCSANGNILKPVTLSYSPLFHGVIMKCFDGGVYLLRDAWSHSSRCAWLSASCI